MIDNLKMLFKKHPISFSLSVYVSVIFLLTGLMGLGLGKTSLGSLLYFVLLLPVLSFERAVGQALIDSGIYIFAAHESIPYVYYCPAWELCMSGLGVLTFLILILLVTILFELRIKKFSNNNKNNSFTPESILK